MKKKAKIKEHKDIYDTKCLGLFKGLNRRFSILKITEKLTGNLVAFEVHVKRLVSFKDREIVTYYLPLSPESFLLLTEVMSNIKLDLLTKDEEMR